MRHRSDPKDYTWSQISIDHSRFNPETGKRENLIIAKGLGHVFTLDNHSEYGEGLHIFLWDESDSRDDDGDLKGTYLTVRGTSVNHFWREQAIWFGWLEAGPFREEATALLKKAGLPVESWTHVRIDVTWFKSNEENDGS